MPESHRSELTALVGSRICHDLISPLGAIGNGLVVLQLSGLAQSPEMALIAESVEHAHARIRFFRIAYGHADDVQVVRGSEMRAVLRAMFHGSRVRVDWLPDDQPRSEAKLAFLILQCLETAMPYGGEIDVQDSHSGREIKARAERLVLDSGLWATLSDPADFGGLRPAQVQFGLLAEQVQTSRRRLQIDLGETEISVLI